MRNVCHFAAVQILIQRDVFHGIQILSRKTQPNTTAYKRALLFDKALIRHENLF